MGRLEHLTAAASLAYVLRAATFAGPIPRIEPAPPEGLPSLAVVVPARNEEATIERCVRSLLAQTLAVEVIVVDDRSTDATPQILARLAANEPRLRIVHGAELPAGWVGKPWALTQGVRETRSEWLLFTDADSVHAPDAAASALAHALREHVDALTIITGQELGTFWERAILPTVLGMVVFATGPIARINDPASPDRALANGQFILVRRAAYDALGGHAALRNAIAEDLEFALRLKRDGRFRLRLADGHAFVSVRMYTSLRSLWDGFTKNVFVGARGNLVALGGGVVAMSALSFLPLTLLVRALVRRRAIDALEVALALGMTTATAGWGMRRVGIDPRLGVFFPIGCGFLALVSVNSTVRVLSGRGVAWRGRRYTGKYGGDAP